MRDGVRKCKSDAGSTTQLEPREGRLAMDNDEFTWSTELSAFDYMLFRADSNARSRSSIMTIELLDVAPDWDRLRNEVERASRIAVRLRQRVVAPLVPLTAARWVIDPDFDVDHHLRRVRLPEPATRRALYDFCAVLHSSPLDPTRPLWQLTLVEGLDDEQADAALVLIISHAVTDGLGAAALDRALRSDGRDPDLGPMPPVPVPEDLSSVAMTRDAVRMLPLRAAVGGVRRVRGAVQGVRQAVRDPAGTLSGVLKVVDSVRKVAGSGAEHSPVLRRRGLGRRIEAYDLPLEDLRAAGRACGCSLNDAFVAAACGVLRRYHEALGVPVKTISMTMPVNVRAADDIQGGGNQWAVTTYTAPVAEPDPVSRMLEVREVVLTARSDSTTNLGTIIAPLSAWVPVEVAAGLTGGTDVQISNVPGSPGERYIAGSRVVGMVPVGPLPGVAMMITLVSLDARCHIGINYDTDSIVDHDLFAECLHAGFDEVVAAGRQKPEPATPRRRRTTATAKNTAATRARRASPATARKR
jgi:diacylglycerol O-acyltransferase / wax synthase